MIIKKNIKNPSEELLKVLREGSDKYETFMPSDLKEQSKKYNISYRPLLDKDNTITWEKIIHDV